MLRPLLFLALLISVLRVQAKEPDRLDSLWQAHGDPQATTHERLLTLHELVLAMRSVDQDSSMVLARNLLAEAKDARDTLMIALGYRDIGLAFLMMRSSVPSLTYLDSSLVYYSSRNDSAYLVGAGAVESNMAFAYRKLGRMEESMEHNRRSIALHRRANDEEGIVYCYNGMGLTFQFQGQPDSALVYYQMCADLAEKLGMEQMAGGAYGNMGNVYAGTGRIGEAIDMTYKSLAILERAKDQAGVAACLTTISELKATTGDNEESLQLLLRAYALYEAADHRQGMMTAGSSIGGRLMELGRPDSAVMMLEKALALERGVDVKDLMGRTLLSLGQVYRLTGRTADASRVLLEAIALAQDLAYPNLQSIAATGVQMA
ncbi:MAG: tetratricopeptide repeat protein [Flavobacteriales bacterium]